MNGYLFLAAAILTEVSATLALRAAVTGRRAWYVVTGAGYLASMTLLSLSLAAGLPLGVAYGIWTATGVALTAVASRLVFGEPLTPMMGGGIALIASGVLLIELGAHA
ncbi:DMT family transporter [Nocardioides sambongensis]|uniref:DMT family transporter n=1 Tax=Nocardioides sambongensis TaxID=2589074 RepID=UPI0011275A5D|nr:SMR family transporter [Nocardioides sambongensis]